MRGLLHAQRLRVGCMVELAMAGRRRGYGLDEGAGPGERASRNGRRLGSVDPSRLPLRQSCPIPCLDLERASFHVYICSVW